MKFATKAAVVVGMIGILALGTVPAVAADAECSNCGPGADWIDSCVAGFDAIDNQDATLGIDLDGDCISDTTIRLYSCGTDFIVNRDDNAGGTIATEIVDLCLTNQTQTLIVGAGLGQGGVLSATTGSIVEDAGDNTLGDSSFDVMFEFDLGGGNYVYNQTPLIVTETITCVPPRGDFIFPVGCLALFDSPVGGTLVANLVVAIDDEIESEHRVDPIPTVSEWGMIALVLLVMGAGTIVFRRIRTVPA